MGTTKYALTVNAAFVKIQAVDANGVAISQGDVLYVKHHGIKSVSCTDKKAIRFNKEGGYGTGDELECSHIIPFDDIYSYTYAAGAAQVPPPSIDTILNNLHTVLIA